MRLSIRVVLIGTLVAGAAGRLSAQTLPSQEPLPSFEVASIRRSAGDLSGRVNSSTILTNTPGRLVITNMTVRGIIRNAYGFFIPKRDDVVGGPAWIDDDRWDVQATVEGDQSEARKLSMLQRLLADRFGLVVHRESRRVDTYILLVDRRDGTPGPALRASGPCVRVPGTTSPPDSRPCGGRGGPGRIMGTGMTAARLASLLETSAGRPVVDQTGLIGEFDVDLTWSPELSIFTALKEQLGLRLEGGSSVVQDSIVIDRIERPSEN
jgi:uncharacterized protein (TIGR03435 family)